jgi:hypothetical protein
MKGRHLYRIALVHNRHTYALQVLLRIYIWFKSLVGLATQ